MRPQLKPIAEQVMVITGASSGIGLATARKAAARGARVVLNARNAEALGRIAEKIIAEGGRAVAAPGDVGDPQAVSAVADRAEAEFGRIDSWVNVAGVGIWGRLAQITPADHERLFRTNYFGVVNGSVQAVRRMSAHGGALINVGSVLSDVGAPLLGAYAASKHAVKGFTETLRMELLAEGAPISVTLIKPSAISTPFPEHARNLTGAAKRVPPPAYAPAAVADAILSAARRPIPQIIVGAAPRPMVLATAVAPRLAHPVLARMLPLMYRTKAPLAAGDSLYAAGSEGRVETPRYHGRRFSLFAEAQMRPAVTAGLGLLALLGAAGLARTRAGRGVNIFTAG
jgi:short-subunit dehydrogenase